MAEDSGSRDGVTRTTVLAGYSYSAGDEDTAAFGRVETVESARRARCVGKGFSGAAAAGRGWGSSLRALVVVEVVAAAPGDRSRSHSDGRQRMRFIVDVPAGGGDGAIGELLKISARVGV